MLYKLPAGGRKPGRRKAGSGQFGAC